MRYTAAIMVAAAIAFAAPVVAFAQEVLPVTTTVVEATWWQQLIAQIQAPILALVTAIIGTVVAVVGTKLSTYVGQKTSNALTEIFQVSATNAAAWVINKIGIDKARNTEVKATDPIVVEAVKSQIDASIPDTLQKLGDPSAKLKADKVISAIQKIVMGMGGAVMGMEAAGNAGRVGSAPTRGK